MRVYISGPIDTNIPDTTRESRKEMFNRCEAWIIQNTDWEPVNPLKVAACIRPGHVKCDLGLEDINTHTWECYLRYDLIALLECEAIVLLPGYTASRGATFECDVAKRLGMKPYIATAEGKVVL